MRKIRNNIFETNSSSTNSLNLAPPSSQSYYIPEKLEILDLYGGRDFELSTPNEKFSCLAYVCDDISDFYGLCYRLYEMGVKEIVLPHPNNFKYPWNRSRIVPRVGEIDDSYEEIKDILTDDDKIKRWIFDGRSYVEGHDDNYDYYD